MNLTPAQLELLWSLGKHALLVGVAAALTAAIPLISTVNLGFYTPFIVMGLSALLKALQKQLEIQSRPGPTPPVPPGP